VNKILYPIENPMLRVTSKQFGLYARVFGALCISWLMCASALAQSAPKIVSPNGSSLEDKILCMEVGRYTAMKTEWPIRLVATADPKVAGAELVQAEEGEPLTEILIQSTGMGMTDLLIFGFDGEVWGCEIRVDINPEHLNEDLSNLFPRSTINVTRSEDVYFVSGILERSAQVKQLHDFMDSAEIKYVDMTSVAGLHQVQIQVKVAEVNRGAIKNMGVNLLSASSSFVGGSFTGTASGGTSNPFHIGALTGGNAADGMPFHFTADSGINPFVTLFAGFPKADLSLYIEALAENQFLRVLAEPTLVALSGEEASFLAGGEFPIPVAQSNESSGGTSITVEYKEFGVKLNFTPQVLGDGTIRLHIAPEVSELSDIGALEIAGFRIPSILARRAETTLELKSGQTFSMAGLLNQFSSARNTRTPILGDLPILGSLFRSVSYQNGESELVVLVTATLVEPVSYGDRLPLPGDHHESPSDWNLFIKGYIENPDEYVDEDTDTDALSQLEGPGAWDSYEGEEVDEEVLEEIAKASVKEMKSTELND
jgi:pilus assembly protein CpaC